MNKLPVTEIKGSHRLKRILHISFYNDPPIHQFLGKNICPKENPNLPHPPQAPVILSVLQVPPILALGRIKFLNEGIPLKVKPYDSTI